MRDSYHSLYQLQTPPTPLLPHKHFPHACCTLYSIPSLHAVCKQCSVPRFACCCATQKHLRTTCSRLDECKRQLCASAALQECQCGCEHNSQTSCTIIYYWCAMGLYSHVALLHCAFSTSLRDFNTLYDQPICYQRWTCFHLHLDSSAIAICYMHEGSCFSDHLQMYIFYYQSVKDKTMSNQLLMERVSLVFRIAIVQNFMSVQPCEVYIKKSSNTTHSKIFRINL